MQGNLKLFYSNSKAEAIISESDIDVAFRLNYATSMSNIQT